MTEFELDFDIEPSEFAKMFDVIKVGEVSYIRSDLTVAAMVKYAKKKMMQAISQPNDN